MCFDMDCKGWTIRFSSIDGGDAIRIYPTDRKIYADEEWAITIAPHNSLRSMGGVAVARRNDEDSEEAVDISARDGGRWLHAALNDGSAADA